MADELKHKYLLKVDKVCEICGFRNKMNWKEDNQMNVVACGDCGEILLAPEEMTEGEKMIITDTVKQALRETRGG